MKRESTLRTCSEGHQYYKSSDCPVCPICDKEKRPAEGFLSSLAAPARRALERNDITSLEKLSEHTEKEILSFHGFGKASIPILKKALSERGLTFKNKDK